MGCALNVLFLFLASFAATSSGINPCLYNREDVLPCLDHFGAGVLLPNANQYSVHATRFQRGPSGFLICVRRKEGELLEAIEDLGTGDVKFLFSPGAEQAVPLNYSNQILAEYEVQCEPEKTAFIDFEALDVEPSNCLDGSQTKCRDYIEINAGTGGTTEYCGDNLPSQPFLVGTGQFTVKFRSSFLTAYPGFRLFVTCFSGSFANIDLNTCTSTGGLAKKRAAAIELVDLAPVQEESSINTLSQISKKPTRPQPLSLTTTDLSTIRTLSKSLFNVALSQARRKITSWPPPSYSRNDPNDILNLNDLKEPVTLSTKRPPTLATLPPDVIIKPVLLTARRRRLAEIQRDLAVPLSSTATLEAVRYGEACNPIVRSVTSSYLTVALRLAPKQLQNAQNEFQKEQSLVQPTLQ